MEDAGLDPIVVARAVKNAWPELAQKVEAAETAPDQNPHMLALRLRVMSGPWTTRNRRNGPGLNLRDACMERTAAQRQKGHRGW